MDINSLLSPDSNTKSGNSTPGPGPTSNNAPTPAAGPSPHKVIQRARSGPARKGKTSSPLAQHVYVPTTGIPESSPPAPNPNPNPKVTGNGAPSTTELPPQLRQASTPGMDTLADLAALQHHQPQRQNAPSMLRSTESYESQLSPSTIHPHVNPINHNTPTPRTSFDIAMSEGPRENARRGYGQTSLDPDAQRLATEAFNIIQENPHTYDAHVKFIGILHTGFVNHVYPPNRPGIHGDPRRYDLLNDLRIAREEMDKLFAMGQDLWAEWIADETLLAHTVTERIAVMELCQRSVEEEFGSTELWKIYGDWVLHLYKEAYEHGPGQWTEEDRMIGREVFSWQLVLDVWQRAAEATKWMINDVEGVWDRFLEVLDNDIDRASSNSQERIGKINNLKNLWDTRLQTPHAEWDQSFQKFSGFISKHYGPANYEEIMAKTVAAASEAKGLYETREKSESELKKAQKSGDKTLEWTAYSEYIDTELARKRPVAGRRNGFHLFHFELVNAVYQRAVLRFPTDVSLWEDYVMFLIDQAMHGHASTTTIATLDRATRHCPWSGNLWSQYLLSSEREGQSFSKISNIKHKATSTGLLDAGGMEEVLKVHTTWCSYLRRRAFFSDSTDEDLDVAQVGILSAMESVQELGEKKYGQSYQGDPLFRLERIYIRYLSESGSWDSAREKFKDLIPRRGNSYEFWLVYYGWELICWRKFVLGEATVDAARRTPSPSYATAVLKQAIKRTDLDWPEKIVQTYIAHCEDYEDSDELQLAVIETRKAVRAVNARRENEAREAAAAQNLQQQQWEAAAEAEASSSEKRKREEDEIDANVEPTNKKARGDEQVPEETASAPAPSRDRENATVVAKNLPRGVTELQVRQFFRNYGTINSVKILTGEEENSTAHVEFEAKEDALGALARDQKLLNDNIIQVQLESSSTLWVTNFPPTADENSIRQLFSKYGEIVDVRLPSLKFKTSRRFCYLQFSSPAAALNATELDNTVLEKGYKLSAKISDPMNKQSRSGPTEEGREIHCKNLHFKLNEDDVEELFLRFGTVEKVSMPRDNTGRKMGYCFVIFSTKEEAEAALSMNNEIFGSRALVVTKSVPHAKRMTNTYISGVGRSPSVEVNGDGSNAVHSHTVSHHRERTLALMNIPDTVNEARVQAMVEPFGELIKISLRPDHQGAIVEYTNVQDAGKAALALEGKEIAPGRALHVGGVAELMALKAEKKTDRITSIKSEKTKVSLQPAGPIKRPQQPGARGGHAGRRGGLGLRRAMAAPPPPNNDQMDTTPDDKSGESGMPKKSNDDFRAMLQQKQKREE
ncbi:hypothetical protein N7509_008620 [Penicillium cosmopolitanum]|uniref:U4/U6 snRNA-associated-splicing factor PRP24 n=1 Tax=Penicillium cosmopolitanum TaxID=1131564 RepID=A0A9W9VN00_9EURO|nr:uncharacterized protein N7509_008620 [Penicillium cosmopolitanum]KAJ5386079.1 hypothetical protein N7509_008620 [Penicillium cosmopolitanum]